MEKCIFLIIFVLSGLVNTESIDDLGCCAPERNHFIANDTIICVDREKNVTTDPYKLDCKNPRVAKFFRVHDGFIKVKWAENGSEFIHTSKTACHGTQLSKDFARSKARVLVCRDEEDPTVKTLGYCMIVSVVFLALTAVIYIILKQWDLFGKSVINFCASLAIGNAIYLAILLMTGYSDMTACAIRGFATYFFLIAAFFWSNSISIQVLIDTRPSAGRAWREYRWYALYSWGMSALLTIIVVIVNYHPGEHIRPGIGLNTCWFHKNQHKYYLHTVMAILLIVNFIIFIYITTMVCRYKFSSSHMNVLKLRLSITVRLIVVMGLPWILEMINGLMDNNGVVGDIIDIFTTLQGILVFLVLVVFRKQVVRSMRDRGWLVCCPGLADWLTSGEDAEENTLQRTEIPMNEEQIGKGVVYS